MALHLSLSFFSLFFYICGDCLIKKDWAKICGSMDCIARSRVALQSANWIQARILPERTARGVGSLILFAFHPLALVSIVTSVIVAAAAAVFYFISFLFDFFSF
jgi:hypothetical protein